MIIKDKEKTIFVEPDIICDELIALCPNLRRPIFCPVNECRVHWPLTIFKIVWHLNDYHEWSRESIADWLDNLYINLTLNSPASLGD